MNGIGCLGDSKELFENGNGWDQWFVSTGEQVESDDTLIRPGMEGNVTFQQDTHTGHALGDEFVTMITQECETRFFHGLDHGLTETGLGIQKVGFDALDVHKEVLPVK